MKQIISIIALITIHMNLFGQKIDVYNPFQEDIKPEKYDPNGGSYNKDPVTIIAIVSGESPGGWSAHKQYSQQIIKLKSWKLIADPEFTRSNLVIFRNVEKSRNYFHEIPNFSVIKMDVFLNKDLTRGVMIDGEIILSDNESINAEVKKVKDVKSITVDSLGEFEYNHTMQNYESPFNWQGKQIVITINVSNHKEITDEIETLNYLVKEQDNIAKQTMQYAIDHILKDRNETWIQPGESVMSESTFKRFSKLESIYIDKNGSFSMDYAEEGIIFNGGFYMINSSIEKGPESHEIGY